MSELYRYKIADNMTTLSETTATTLDEACENFRSEFNQIEIERSFAFSAIVTARIAGRNKVCHYGVTWAPVSSKPSEVISLLLENVRDGECYCLPRSEGGSSEACGYCKTVAWLKRAGVSTKEVAS